MNKLKLAAQQRSQKQQQETTITIDEDYESRSGGLRSENPIPLWKRIESARKQTTEYQRLIDRYTNLLAATQSRLSYLEQLKTEDTFTPSESELQSDDHMVPIY